MKATEMLPIEVEQVAQPIQTNNLPLREHTKQMLEKYFANLDGFTPAGLYNLVLSEIEPPVLEVVMSHVKGNQCKAALLLGISRGTLRKKLKLYNLE